MRTSCARWVGITMAGLVTVWGARGLGQQAAASPQASGGQDIGVLDQQKADKAFPVKPSYSPYAGRTYPTRPYFGDTHLHTAFSMDAGAFGARLGPAEAFRFARGEEVLSNSGQPVKL